MPEKEHSNINISKDPETESEEEKRKREEWEKFKADLKELNTKVLDKARQILGKEYLEWTDKRYHFAMQIKKNYPDYQDYIAFHVLAFSTREYEDSPKLDFPEPDSVKTFLENLEKELDETKENKLKETGDNPNKE